jgi:dihydroorotate dehydrogenase (fumarate)
MDLSTNYLGLALRSPLVPSAGPYAEKVESLKALEDAGAGAVVLHSLFEEQIRQEERELVTRTEAGTESFAESLSYFPAPSEYRLGTEEYLRHIEKLKQALRIPVIASLNGSTPGGWTKYARKMESAGADALELNIYFMAADPGEGSAQVEGRYLEIVRAVKAQVKVPVAVKLSQQFTSIANMAQSLDEAGADGLVLFNRFYQPDFDLEALEVTPNLVLSTSWESRFAMRWIGVLFGKVKAGLAATGGVHTHEDAVKLIMSGADVVQICSAILTHGPKRLAEIEKAMRDWMAAHEYESVKQMKGSMSQRNVPDPASYARANYMKVLTSYR